MVNVVVFNRIYLLYFVEKSMITALDMTSVREFSCIRPNLNQFLLISFIHLLLMANL